MNGGMGWSEVNTPLQSVIIHTVTGGFESGCAGPPVTSSCISRRCTKSLHVLQISADTVVAYFCRCRSVNTEAKVPQHFETLPVLKTPKSWWFCESNRLSTRSCYYLFVKSLYSSSVYRLLSVLDFISPLFFSFPAVFSVDAWPGTCKFGELLQAFVLLFSHFHLFHLHVGLGWDELRFFCFVFFPRLKRDRPPLASSTAHVGTGEEEEVGLGLYFFWVSSQSWRHTYWSWSQSSTARTGDFWSRPVKAQPTL